VYSKIDAVDQIYRIIDIFANSKNRRLEGKTLMSAATVPDKDR